MAHSDVHRELAEFADIVKLNEPLAPYTLFKIGGPAEVMVQPRSVAELAGIVKRCCAKRIPLHILGAGCSVLVLMKAWRASCCASTAPRSRTFPLRASTSVPVAAPRWAR